MIELHTLGSAVIKIGDREIRPTSPAVFAALLYLGVERGRRVPRTALQELLFPETDERSGAHSLRQLLYKLRQLGASVHADGDVVWLAAEDVSDDYSAPAHTNQNGNGYRTGPFLGGYTPRVSPAFDEWLESQRSAIEINRRRALIKQMLARRDVADWPSVERIAQDVLASDPFNEEATLVLAESTALAGSKAEAIRILERYESETGRADLKLPAQVLRRRISERLPDRRRRAMDTPFVGREAEAQIMREAIVQLRAGQGGSIVISGEPGIGKTRLIEETAALALLEGVNVHVVRCQPHYVNRPMGVFIEWVPQLIASRGALGVAPETLEHLELLTSHRDDGVARPTNATDDVTRSGTLFAAVRDLVDAVASEGPILLVVEDSHWADPTSVGELCALLERRQGSALLIALSTRNGERLKKHGAIGKATVVLRLRPLGDLQMVEIGRHLLDGSARTNNRIAEWCATTAAGNPLFLEMLCAHYQDTHRAFAVPPSLRSATLRRIEQLTSDQCRLLEVTALLGRHATLRALRALTDLGSLPFLNAVLALEEGGYIRTSDGVARLSHDLLRECVLELTPPLSRRLLHGMVAAHLGERYREAPTSALLWDCAEHWAASGEQDEAFAFLKECARHAATIGRAAQASDILHSASQFATSQANTLALLEDTARVAKATNNWPEVLRTGQALRELSEDARLHTDWELSTVEATWTLSFDSSHATDQLFRCARTVQAPKSHRTEASVLLLRIAFEQVNFELAHEAFRAVESILDQASLITSNRLTQLIYHTSFGDVTTSIDVANRLQHDLDKFDMLDRLRLARNIVAARCLQGDVIAGIDLGRECFELAKRLDLRTWQYDLACICCYVLLSAEDFVGARDWHERAAGLRSASHTTGADTSFLISGAQLAIQNEDVEGSERFLKGLNSSSVGESVRGKALLESQRLQTRQLNPDFVCDTKVVSDLMALFTQVKRSPAAEPLVVALGVEFERRGRSADLRQLALEYSQSLRAGQPIAARVRNWIAGTHEDGSDPSSAHRR